MMDLKQEAIEAGLTPTNGPWLTLHMDGVGAVILGAGLEYIQPFLELARDKHGDAAVDDLLQTAANTFDVEEFRKPYNMLKFHRFRHGKPGTGWTTLAEWLQSEQSALAVAQL